MRDAVLLIASTHPLRMLRRTVEPARLEKLEFAGQRRLARLRHERGELWLGQRLEGARYASNAWSSRSRLSQPLITTEVGRLSA